MKIRLPKIIRDDFLRKLVALFFAVLIWLVVNSQLHEFETFHDIPVTLRHEPDKVMLERRIVTATVTLRGSRRRLQDIQSNDISISAYVPEVREGVYYYDVHLSGENVRLPPGGARVASIEPQSVRLQVDRIVTKETPVRVRETGELSYGYKVVQRSVVPAEANVSGPSRIVEDIEAVFTEPVMLDETVQRSFEVDEVKIVPIPRLRINPATVHVAYEIVHQSGEQSFSNIPVQLLLPRGGQLAPAAPLPPATVTLRGPRTGLDAVKPHMIHPFVDLTGITAPGRYTMRVNVWLDDSNRFMVERVHPAEVEAVLVYPPAGPAPPESATPDAAPTAADDAGD